MKSSFYHIRINIDFTNLSFYKNLMEFMGWNVIFETDEVIGYKSDRNGDLWFCKTVKNAASDYDAKGVNHISLRVDTLSDVDEIKNHLEKNNIKMLFDTPKHRPEFAASKMKHITK